MQKNLDLIKLLAETFAGNTQLPWYKEAQFQNTMAHDPRYTAWKDQIKQRYHESPNLDSAEYDYRGAVSHGVTPQPDPYDENQLHWDSRYKSSTHPRRFLGGEQVGMDPLQVYDTDTMQQLSPLDIANLAALFGKRFQGLF